MLLLFCLELQILEFATTEMENETNVSNLQFTAVYIFESPWQQEPGRVWVIS